MLYTGFPKKDASFSKWKNIPNLLSDVRERKIVQIIDFSYFSNRASFMGNPVSFMGLIVKIKKEF